ncbi:flavin-containing monooxygenase [Pimelobacter simplex]|uniref:flavin-containing monooxygenase n=1 Tax=Nocardioides simplex TaxID=2045 RepID=UPI00381D9633
MASSAHKAPKPGGPRVAIIGSGFSGIAAAVALTRRGIDYEIFESAEGIGGTWWKNRYPGAEVDLESHVYSFSFERSDWTRTHAGWQELQAYLQRTADRWQVTPRVHLRTKVEEARWDESTATYRLRTEDGRAWGPYAAVISAVGFLNIPLVPPFARGETPFQGDLCHTSTWPDGLTMDGKSVAVVGTGSSAVQVVQEAARTAEDVKIFQLEPNWLLPKNSRDFTPLERRLNRLAPVYRWRRLALYLDYDLRQFRSGHARIGGRSNTKRKEASLRFMQESLARRPDLLEHTTPTFPFEARRTVVSDTYYPALLDPKVTLVPFGVKDLTSRGVLDANGDEHELDMVVLATGFDAANYLGNYQVIGEQGRSLHDTWNGEPEAFLGLMVPGFPNFFMMYGPNTNSIPLVHFYEAQAAFAAGLIARLGSGKRRIRLREKAMRQFNSWVQGRLRKTVWAATDNYFQAGSGKVVSQWPEGPTAYILATKLLRRWAVDVD